MSEKEGCTRVELPSISSCSRAKEGCGGSEWEWRTLWKLIASDENQLPKKTEHLRIQSKLWFWQLWLVLEQARRSGSFGYFSPYTPAQKILSEPIPRPPTNLCHGLCQKCHLFLPCSCGLLASWPAQILVGCSCLSQPTRPHPTLRVYPAMRRFR